MRSQKKGSRLIGGRILKTGIAALVTAFICFILDWPAMFAVITAIVTVEPTAADSIRKAFVRFPASAIGAAFAVLFTYLFGDSPITYGLVTFFTIMTCSKLKLDDGILVATLTGVAMISTVHEEFISSFFIRLGTTSLGLIVSSLVNIFLMPPKYTVSIMYGINQLFSKALFILKERVHSLLNNKTEDENLSLDFEKLKKEIEQIEKLCHYQFLEWRIHRYSFEEMRTVRFEFKKLTILKQVVYHMDNLFHIQLKNVDLPTARKELIHKLLLFQIDSFSEWTNREYDRKHYHETSNEMIKWFLQLKSSHLENEKGDYHMSPEISLLYELLSINELIEESFHLYDLEHRYQIKS